MSGNTYDISIGGTCANSSIGIDDTCIIHCDRSRQKNVIFDCGNAGHCVFECEEKKCMEEGTLNAQNAHNLTVRSAGSECMKHATVNLPNDGNAIFSMQKQKSLKEMIVNSGANTQHIFIDCTYGNGDECRDIMINAQTAQYLEIKIGANSDLAGVNSRAVIYCPQNSLYDGGQRSSCVIDVSEGGTLSFVTIHTLYGIPNDVWIKTGSGTLSQVQITCFESGISTNSGNSFVKQGDCWNVGVTTWNPTYFPTVNPSFKPTAAPITSTNTANMVQTSTKMHDLNTYSSSVFDDILATELVTNDDNILLYNEDTNDNFSNDFIWSSNVFRFSIIGIAVAICCFVVGFCYIRRRRRIRKKHVIHYKLKSNSSNHMVAIDVNSIIMKPGQSVLPVFSPNNSQDDEDNVDMHSNDSNDTEPSDLLNGIDPLELADLTAVEVDEGEQNTQHFMDEYYDDDEIETDDDEGSAHTVSIDESVESY